MKWEYPQSLSLVLRRISEQIKNVKLREFSDVSIAHKSGVKGTIYAVNRVVGSSLSF